MYKIPHDCVNYEDSFPAEPVFVLHLPFAIILATLLLMLVGKILSVWNKADKPDYLGILGIGFGVLDFTSDCK